VALTLYSGSHFLSLTRKRMTFVSAAVIVYGQKIGRSLMILVYAIAVVFTNVMRLRVVGIGGVCLSLEFQGIYF